MQQCLSIPHIPKYPKTISKLCDTRTQVTNSKMLNTLQRMFVRHSHCRRQHHSDKWHLWEQIALPWNSAIETQRVVVHCLRNLYLQLEDEPAA